jgi:hypothetical protein
MPVLLFRLNSVPEDEADDIRALLDANHIHYYETQAGRWGVSVAAIWLRDDDADHEETARRLIDDYQRRRSQDARAEYDLQLREGRAETLTDRFRREPLRLAVYAAIILAILYFTLAPFLHWR